MKKKDGVVGVISGLSSIENFSKKIGSPPRKKRDAPTMYWQTLVKVWFDLYEELIPPPPGEEKAVPCFDTVETAQMKIILRELRKRAEDKNVEWTEEVAKMRWKLFLRKAFEDDWISKNFMLRIISTNKTKIFNNQITPKKNGGNINAGTTGKTPVASIKSKGGFGHL